MGDGVVVGPGAVLMPFERLMKKDDEDANEGDDEDEDEEDSDEEDLEECKPLVMVFILCADPRSYRPEKCQECTR